MANDNISSVDGSASSDAEILKQLVKKNVKATKALVSKLEELTTTLSSGLSTLSDTLKKNVGSLESVVTSCDGIAAQLTAINSLYTQSDLTWKSCSRDLAKIATAMDTSSSASMKMSSATNPHSRPINLATTSGVKGWLAGVDLPAHIPVDIHVGPEAKALFRVLLEHLDVCGFGSLLRSICQLCARS